MAYIHRLVVTGCLFGTLAVAGGSAAKADVYTLIMPPIKTERDVNIVKNSFLKIVSELAKPGDIIIAYDGVRAKLVTSAKMPNKPVLKHKKIRFKYARKAFQDLGKFLKSRGGLASLRPPTKVFDNFAKDIRSIYADQTFRVLHIGSMLQHDRRWVHTSMRGGRYPSDAHIFKADNFISPYGVSDHPNAMQKTSWHVCDLSKAYANDAHRKAVHRFWSLRFAAQKGRLATLTSDIRACIERFINDSPPAQTYQLDTSNSKPKMISIKKREVSNTASDVYDVGEAFMGDDVEINTEPPLTTRAVAKIGIRWPDELDLDLWVWAYPGAQPLYFNRKKITEGRFHKDWTVSPTKQAFEFVEFNTALDISRMIIRVNFYSGTVRQDVKGVLRISMEGDDGGIWETPFVITAKEGNEGKGQFNSPQWIEIKPKNVLGLSSS